jgi:hypothetical protein
VAIRLSEGFMLVQDTQEIRLSQPQTVALAPTADRAGFQLQFRAPSSSTQQALELLFSRFLLILLGLLVTFASPDIVPTAHLNKVLMVASAITLLLLALRWWLAFRNRGPLIEPLSDTGAVVLYGIGATLIWRYRRRKSTSGHDGAVVEKKSATGGGGEVTPNPAAPADHKAPLSGC